MATVELPSDAADDAGFIDLAARAINGAAARVGTDLLHLVKIDHWFGDRWFRFGGKTLGALGIRPRVLTVPPFHPHRVIAESRYRLTDPPLRLNLPPAERLHGLRPSASNLRNPIMRHGESTTFAWYTSGTATSDRGAVMVYTSTSLGRDAWYAGLVRDDVNENWRVLKGVGVDERLWAKLTAAPRVAAAPQH